MSEAVDMDNSVIVPKTFALIAAIAAIAGLIDSVYLSVKHFAEEVVPCSLITGCETVLTSAYAEIYGIPLALFGAVAYFLAFSLAILTYFGNRRMWFFFGCLSVLMLLFTVWLVYLQAFVIEAFCQFCLISAATTLTLFILAIVSRFWRFK